MPAMKCTSAGVYGGRLLSFLACCAGETAAVADVVVWVVGLFDAHAAVTRTASADTPFASVMNSSTSFTGLSGLLLRHAKDFALSGRSASRANARETDRRSAGRRRLPVRAQVGRLSRDCVSWTGERRRLIQGR